MSNINKPRTTSGIQIDDSPMDSLKGTMKLTRNMSMAQSRGKKDETASDLPPPVPPALASGMKYAVANKNNVVLCPDCQNNYEIAKEYYGLLVECEECGTEFIIRPPGWEPYKDSGKQAEVNKPSFSRIEDYKGKSTNQPTTRTKKSKKDVTSYVIGGVLVFLVVVFLIIFGVVVVTYK